MRFAPSLTHGCKNTTSKGHTNHWAISRQKSLPSTCRGLLFSFALTAGALHLYSALSKENAVFLVFWVGCRLPSPWLSEIPAANSRHNLRLPETYRYREEGTGERLNLCSPDLPFSQQKQDGPPVAVTSGMKFGIQSSFCATDETWRIPFLSRIAAVR